MTNPEEDPMEPVKKLVRPSEGAMIAPMLAAQSDDVAFIVLLAGPGVPGDELLSVQSELILKAGGSTADALKLGPSGAAKVASPDPMSAPAQKARPAPVRTITRTSSSSSQRV